MLDDIGDTTGKLETTTLHNCAVHTDGTRLIKNLGYIYNFLFWVGFAALHERPIAGITHTNWFRGGASGKIYTMI